MVVRAAGRDRSSATEHFGIGAWQQSGEFHRLRYLYESYAPAAHRFRDARRAFDIVTGQKLWEFWTVPQPGQPFHDTWGEGWKNRSGTNMWAFSAPIDAERGIVLRFGAYHDTTMSGLRWHLPWPIERVEKVNASVTESFAYQGSMLTRDENIVLVDLIVQYRRADPGPGPSAGGRGLRTRIVELPDRPHPLSRVRSGGADQHHARPSRPL